MKATRRILSLTLALIMAALVFCMPVSATGTAPLIMVNGIGSTPLYKNFGTDKEELVFSGDDAFVEGLITDIGSALISGIISYSVNNKSYDAFADSFFPSLKPLLSSIGYGLDGKSIDTTIGFYQNEKPMSQYTDEEKAVLSEFTYAYAEQYGEDFVYNFSYDWREDPITIAQQLDAFINKVAPSGKVNIVGMSMGANIVLAYLAQFGGAKIKNCVFAAPAWQGTSLVGNVVTDNLEIDIFAVENYLVQLANVSATTHIIAFVISYIASDEGLSHEYFGDINAIFQNINPRVYTDAFIPYFAGMPGIWGLVPQADYEAGIEFIYESHDIEIDPEVEAKLNAYHEIQGNAKQVIEDAMADGMNFGIVCGYNCQMIPLSTEYESSDTIIDTELMSGGATCAKYLQAFDDWDEIYIQKVKDGHNHMSWDSKVDASTAMFPEYTWFVKNMQHNSFNRENGTLDVVMWLLDAEEQVDINTDPESFPQFMLYNTYKKTTKPMPVGGILGDVNLSTAVNTEDARLALDFATGKAEPNDEQFLLGDINENGTFETDDVIDILKIAAGIEY